MWHTSYHITYDGSQDLSAGMLRVMNIVDSVLSPFNAHSSLSLLNRSDSIEAPKELLTVFTEAKRIHSLTGGLFDPSAAPLINAYGFGYKNGTPPDSTQIADILSYIGIQRVLLRNNFIVKPDRRMEFNFSAIAKGYGCDLVADYLRSQGVHNYMVEIGGEVVVSGHSPSGGKWRIGIDRPDENLAPGENPQMIIAITDCAVATSGNYRNFKVEGGKKTGHIVNPLTGVPAESDIASATVIAPRCITADALATSLMVMSSSQAKSFIKDNDITALLILKDGTLYMSPSMQALKAI